MRKIEEKELALLKVNVKLINEVHSGKWYKKYCKNPYYFAQFGITKNKRG